MYTYVHYENEKTKQVGKVLDRAIPLNKTIDRHSQLNSKKKRPLQPPPQPPLSPMQHRSVSTQRSRHLFQTHKHVQEYSQYKSKHTEVVDQNAQQKSIKSTDAIDRIRLHSTDFEEPMPRSSTPNLHTCIDCNHYTSHCICTVNSNVPNDYANWKHNFHTSPLVFRPVENIPEAISGNATITPKIQLPCEPPKTPIRTTSLMMKSSTVIKRILEIRAPDMDNDRQQSQNDFQCELLTIQKEFAYMKALAVHHSEIREIVNIFKKSTHAYPSELLSIIR